MGAVGTRETSVPTATGQLHCSASAAGQDQENSFIFVEEDREHRYGCNVDTMREAIFSHKECWRAPSSPTGYATDGGFPLQIASLIIRKPIFVRYCGNWHQPSQERCSESFEMVF